MKRILVLLIPFLFGLSAHAQLSGMMNKLKNKVASKLMGKDSTANAQGAGQSGGAQTQGGDGASQGVQTPAVAQGNQVSPGAQGTNGAAPQAPKFPVTGTMVKATKIVFGIDAENDWLTLLKNPMVQDYISRLRQKGVTGTDREVLMTAIQHPDAYSDIVTDMRGKYGASANLKPMPSLIFSVFFNEYDYVISSDHIRTEFGKPDTSGGQPAFGGALVQALAPGAVTLIDINARQSYAIANYLGIVPAAIIEDLTSFQDAFGLTNYFKKYMHQPNIKLQPMGHTMFHGYNANVVRMEIPVTPTTDEKGKTSDGLLFLHSLLSGHMEDIGGKHYDPAYKLYLETYFSHDLDASIPKAVTSDKTILDVDGFYVGSLLKDENGNQVVCDIRHVEPNIAVDAGQFMIPDGYPKMTHAQFHQKVQEKLHGH